MKDSIITNLIEQDLKDNTPQELLSLYPVVVINGVENLHIEKQNSKDDCVEIIGSGMVNVELSAESKDQDVNSFNINFTYRIMVDKTATQIKQRSYDFDLEKFYQ